jgi:hypothetical protein
MNKKIIIGISIVIIILSVIIFQFLKQNPQPQFVEGEESLEITILGPANNPFPNLEVDLWTLENPNGPPTAGYLITDAEGKVLFKILEGEYLIGFNGYNFPKEFINPEKVSVSVQKGTTTKEIILELS